MTDRAAPAPNGRAHRLQAWFGRWRTSLQLRVIGTAMVLGIVAMSALAIVQTYQIRDGLFSARMAEAMRETSASTELASDQFASASTDSLAEVNQLASDTVRQLKSVSPSGREVALISTPGGLTFNDSATTSDARAAISESLRDSVQKSSGAVVSWQSVRLAEGSPGLVIGAKVVLPGQRPGELYFVYDLATEQQTLELTERVLIIGALIAVLVLALVTFVLTRQVVTPVTSAARVAERLAAGQLSERMTVRGQDELATLARSFNEMAASLQHQFDQMAALSRMQRQFVSDVSHELRTPLTTIRMAGEMLYDAKDSFPEPVARSAELMNEEIDRFEALLADLLEISRHDAGEADLDAQDRDMREIVESVIDATRALAADKGVPVRRFFTADGARADLDARRIGRIVRNLLGNAIEHADGKPVDVYVDANSTAVAVVVRDHGVGMSSDQVAHVFDRFWRADPARTRTTGGTGLGLAISQEDARLHGGRIDAWGEIGEGASFRLLLPRRAGMAIDRAPLDLVPPAAEAAADSPRRGEADPGALPAFALPKEPT